MAEVTWQGGCELRDTEGVRIGNLYVTSDDIVFIEAGRGGMTQYRPALVLLTMAGALMVIPLAVEIYCWTYKGGERASDVLVFELIALVLALTLGAVAGRLAQRLKTEYRAGLLRLGEHDGSSPEPAMLQAAAETVKGSLSLPRKDAETLRREGERLILETRLGETWDLMILPDPERFMAAVKG